MIMNIIIGMKNIICTHTNNSMNTAIAPHIKSVVSNISMLINVVVINKISIIDNHINNTVTGTNIIVNNN